MFNKLKSSSSSKNSSNIPNSLFSSKMKAIKAAVISGFMLIGGNASANNDIQDTKSLEIGDSISQKLGTTIKIQGDLATLGISSISRNTAEKVINAGSVVTALKLLDLDSSVKSRKKYIEILGLGVDLSIDENGKVIDREKNKEANNTFYRSIITSINESVIQAEKNQIDTFKILIANPSKINQQEEKTNENNISLDINSANVSSDGKQQAGGSITSDYGKTQINVSNDKNSGTNIHAEHLFDNGVKVKVQDSKSNSNIGLATEVGEDFYVGAQVGDNPAATLEYTKDEYSAGVQAGKEGVGATMGYNDEDTSVSLNKTIQGASARAIQQFDIFGNELAASGAVNYSNAKELGYNLGLDYYMPNTAFGIEYEKFLEKSEYTQFKLTQRVNDYLIARFGAGVYKQHGFEYDLESIISGDAQFPGIIDLDKSSLPSGEYSEKQNNAFAELHYYPKNQANSSVKSVSVKLAYFDMAANKLDTGFRVAENNEITIVDQINISTLGAETFTAEISSQFKLLDNLSSTFSIGGKFVNYGETYGQTADSEQYLTYKGKISYLPTESLLLQAHYSDQGNYQESGLGIGYDFGWKLSPVLGVTHISGENIKSDNVFGLQFKADLGDVFSTKSTVRSTHNSSMNETKRLQAESKIVYEREHLMDLYKEVGELYYESNDDKLIGKYNIKIPLGVALTGELRTNKPELDQYFEAKGTELHILNAAISLQKYAGEKIEIIADQVGTQIMHVKLPTLEGSTIYKTQQHIGNLHKNSENEFLFNDNKIETELYAGNLNILTVNNIFNGTILSEIITEGFLKNLISSEVLNYISDNISSINQEELLLDIQNGEVISIGDIDENINNAPVANNDSFTTAEDTEKTINFTELLKNDTDKESQGKLEITHVDGMEISDSGEIELEYGVLKFIEGGFTFIPAANKSGVTQVIEYRIEDEGGKADVANIEIEIQEKNDAPEIILENINLDEESTIIIAKKDIVVDIDTALEDLNFQVLINGLKVDTEFTSEGLRVTGLLNLAEDDRITLQVSDGEFDVKKEIPIKIKNINDAPFAKNFSEVIEISETGEKRINLLDEGFGDSDTPYGDSLTFSIQGNANNAEIDGNELVLKGFDVNEDTEFTVSLIATDIAGEQVGNSVDVKVNVTHTPPVMLDVPDTNITFNAGTTLDISDYVTLTNGDSISTYTLTGTLPTGLTFNSTNGTFGGTTTQVGTYNMSVTATDNDGVSNSDTFVLTVLADEVAPIMGDVPDTNITFNTGTTLDISDYVTLTNGDSISTYTLTGTLPTGLTFNSTNGTFGGTTTQVGTYNMSVTATDNDGVSNSDTFVLTVVNTAPTASDFTSSSAGQSISVLKTETNNNISDAEQSDSDLNVSVTGFNNTLLSGVTVDVSNNISAIVNDGAAGNATITYKVNDGFVDSNIATITVVADKKKPIYSSNTIAGLDKQGQACSNQTITVTDFSDLASASIHFADLYTDVPVAGDINNLRYSGKTVTFDCTTPNVEDVKIRATFTDKYGNTSTVADIKTLSLDPANTAPQVTNTSVTYTHDFVGPSDTKLINTEGNVSDDYTIDSNLEMIFTQLPTKGVISEESGTTFRYTRTDNSAGDTDTVKYKYKDENGLLSVEVTMILDQFDDF